MRFWRRLGEVNLQWALLGVMVVEVTLNRLTVPALRPPGDIRPPDWHRNLDLFGLFVFHLATTMALGVLAQSLWRTVSRRDGYARPVRVGIGAAGAIFLAAAAINVAGLPTAEGSFLLEASFTLFAALLVSAQLYRGGDALAKVGLALMAMPLIVHFYSPFAMRVLLDADGDVWTALPDHVREFGQWSLVSAALLSPYCLAPRPFVDSAARLAPLAVSGFVGLIGAVILRQHFEVGMLVASRGLGFELGPAAPTAQIALYLLALASLTWTAVSCFTATAPSRRLIGAGIGLVVAGGYAFTWPLQLLVAAAGLIAIGEGSRTVVAEERDGGAGRDVHIPSIADEIWQSWIAGLAGALDAGGAAVTVQGEGGSETHLAATRHGVRVSIRMLRSAGALGVLEVVCGDGDAAGEPAWTLSTRGERLRGAHPEPPQTHAPLRKTADASFDRRFRLRDGAGHTERLLDEGLRARAAALLDGWLALWPDRSLRYRLYPGRGAPLDHPVPITLLAFRDGDGATGERMVALIDLLTEMSARAGLGRE